MHDTFSCHTFIAVVISVADVVAPVSVAVYRCLFLILWPHVVVVVVAAAVVLVVVMACPSRSYGSPAQKYGMRGMHWIVEV